MFGATSLLSLVLLALPTSLAATCSPGFPDLPLTVSGRDMISASGAKVVYAGVNWNGHGETMLPEGLQYNSIDNIVNMIKDVGVNVVRLTYAIEMVDDIYNQSPNQTLGATVTNALGQTNGQQILQRILNNNPQFTASTTRLQVFDAIAAALNKQKIWVHLDNHVSKAEWCCGNDDGNAWFGDTKFDVANWKRGLGYMAAHGKQWPNLASMALRNELRDSKHSLPVTWNSWVENVIPAADAIHGNNSDVLIFFSGQNFDLDDTYFVQRQTWNSETFTPERYGFQNKIVYELHNYQNSAQSCENDMQPGIYNAAYCAMALNDKSCPNHGPVVMTEFGFDITDNSFRSVYAQCIAKTLLRQPGGPGGWMQWVLSGSYYIRSGTQDYEETWGLLKHDWSGWRNQSMVDNYLKPFLAETVSNCGNGVSNACAAQPAGINHKSSPDTAAAFKADTYYSNATAVAATPSGFKRVYSNRTARTPASGNIGSSSLSSYDVASCASKCTSTSGCTSFNIYFQRAPSLKPDSFACNNPPSNTYIQCNLFNSAMSSSSTSDSGSTQNQFEVVYAGSNGYTRA